LFAVSNAARRINSRQRFGIAGCHQFLNGVEVAGTCDNFKHGDSISGAGGERPIKACVLRANFKRQAQPLLAIGFFPASFFLPVTLKSRLFLVGG